MKTLDRYPEYQFHEDGTVTHPSRVVKMKTSEQNGYVIIWLKSNYQYKPSDDQSKYLLWHTTHLHRVICEAFHGPCPDGMECDHIDNDKLNNSASNLRWVTASFNTRKSFCQPRKPFPKFGPMSDEHKKARSHPWSEETRLKFAEGQKLRTHNKYHLLKPNSTCKYCNERVEGV